MSKETENMLKPFIKWAGGKNKLIKQLKRNYPTEITDGKITKYVEPFVGGGAVLIDILSNPNYRIEKAYACDVNVDLINCYKTIKNEKDVERLILILGQLEIRYKELSEEDRKKYYYAVREQYNGDKSDDVQRAAEFIFLNKTCFNGLYRVNASNKFNVPYNNAKNPLICDFDNLRALSRLFREHNVEFMIGDYTVVEAFVDDNTFVYFDPPYRPLSKTSNFTSYSKDSFDDEDQEKLSLFYKQLDKKKAKLMLSNSNPKNANKNDTFFEGLYKGFNIYDDILAKRSINSKGDGRKEISELLITNYPRKQV